MDIQIVAAAELGQWLVVGRTLDGAQDLHRYPRETLAIRAAEYDLDPADPFVLDMVLLERFIDDGDEIHPLFSSATISSATDTMRSRIAQVQDEHGAPKGKLRPIAAAIKAGVATPGAGLVQAAFQRRVDPAVRGPVQYIRDAERRRLANLVPAVEESLTERLVATVARARMNEHEIRTPPPAETELGTKLPRGVELRPRPDRSDPGVPGVKQR